MLDTLLTIVECPGLTPEQVEKIATAMPTERDRLLTYLIAYAGLRPLRVVTASYFYGGPASS